MRILFARSLEPVAFSGSLSRIGLSGLAANILHQFISSHFAASVCREFDPLDQILFLQTSLFIFTP